MTGIRKIELSARADKQEDGSITLSFILTGVGDIQEAAALAKMVTEKLQRGIVKTLKKRGQQIYDSGRGRQGPPIGGLDG